MFLFFHVFWQFWILYNNLGLLGITKKIKYIGLKRVGAALKCSIYSVMYYLACTSL